MTRNLHTAILVLLGLSVLAGCSHESMPEQSQDALQVTSGPVNVAMTLSIKGFGGDSVLTKGDFYEQGNDFVEVHDTLFYDHERIIKDAGIFVFEAESAFVDDGAGKYKFDPAGATYIMAVKPEYMDVRDTLTRIQFKLDKPYKSLAVLILANYHLASYSASGSSMQDVMAYLSAKGQAQPYNPDQDEYFTNGIPMHGWKVFGSLEGLATSASDAQKAKCRLRYYKGMTTPLTVVGFEDPARLEEYAKEGTGKGVVNQDDHVQMEFALSRLQLRYVPKKDAIARDNPATSEVDSVRVSGVKLSVYKDLFRAVPENWFTDRPNPYTATTYDASREVGNFAPGEVTFKEIPSKSGKSKAFVAYVPEISVASVEKAIADDPTNFKEPSLVVEVKVKVREKTDGTVVTYTYDRNKITVNDGTNPPREYVNYGDEGWVSWLKLKTVQERFDKDNNPVTIGTRYSLVRHYSYEWVAVGINE